MPVQLPLEDAAGPFSVFDILEYLIVNSSIGGAGQLKLNASVDSLRSSDSLVPGPAVPLEITSSSVPEGATGVPYSASFEAAGGISPVTWTVAGLPAGLTASTAGVITGTPATPATSTVTVIATDS